MSRIKELEEKIKENNHLYWDLDSPQINDYEYDFLVEELKRLNPNSSILNELGPTFIDSFGNKVEHKIPMLSLGKSYDDKGILNWLEKFQGQVVCTPKFDGLSLSIKYGNKGEFLYAATRGNGLYGEEVSLTARLIKDIPNKVSIPNIEVRGEVYMRSSVFQKFKDKFSNPRNLASGALKQKDPEKSKEYDLSFVAYDLIGIECKSEFQKFEELYNLGFPKVEVLLVERDNIIVAYQYILQKRYEFDFEIDGVVFKTNNLKEQERLGYNSHEPKYAIAYKFEGESATTKLIDIVWQVSRSGIISPVAIIEPVELSGAVIRRATLHNINILKELGLLNASMDAELNIVRRGGVIPKIEFVHKKGTSKNIIKLPSKCPSCNSPTVLKGDFLFCSDPKNCSTADIESIIHFCKVLDIKGFGEKLIRKLYEDKLIKKSLDLFFIKKEDLANVDRMGERISQKLINEINNHRNITLDIFLRALSIPNLGKHASKILVEEFDNMDDILKLSYNDLENIPSLGSITSSSIVNGLKEKRNEIRDLLKQVKIINNVKKNVKTKISGKSFVFTGKLETLGRKEAQEIVEKLGGEIYSGVRKDLDFLVVGNGSEEKSSKQEVAEKHIKSGASINIISESEFMLMTK